MIKAGKLICVSDIVESEKGEGSGWWENSLMLAKFHTSIDVCSDFQRGLWGKGVRGRVRKKQPDEGEKRFGIERKYQRERKRGEESEGEVEKIQIFGFDKKKPTHQGGGVQT